MNNNENTKTISHLITLALVQNVDQMIETHLERTGTQLSSVGVLLDIVTSAADALGNGFTTVRFVLDYRGYTIEFDGRFITEDEVLKGLAQALEVLADEYADEY